MRLGQLSRSVNVASSEIVAFLASREILIKDHPNVKVDDFEGLVMAHFGAQPVPPVPEDIVEFNPVPDTQVELLVHEATASTTSEPAEPALQPPTEEVTETASASINNAPALVIPSEEAVVAEEPAAQDVPLTGKSAEELAEESYAVLQALQGAEVIKAPKVELTGLKVVGKIDLPEPKPKADKSAGEKQEGKHRKSQLTPEERERQRVAKKLAIEKQQALREQRTKEKEARKIKEKKRKYYESKVTKAPAPPKPVESRKKVTKSASTHNRPAPRTWLGKFWRWLNT